MKKTFDGFIDHTGDTDCSIAFTNETYVYRELREAFGNHDKVTVIIQSRKKPRSLKQNAVLHWYVNEIAEETGIEASDVKELLRHKYLGVDVTDRNGEIMADRETGEVLRRYRSTTELSTVEFNEFTEKIRLWSNDYLNMQLPLPNEETEFKFKK